MTYGLPTTYTHRTAPAYFEDNLPDSTAWQADVYRLAAKLAREHGVKRLVDIGCGRGGKIAPYAQEFQIDGIDYGANIDYCAEHIPLPNGGWLRADLNHEVLPSSMFHDSVVICADVIEHLPTPDALIESLRHACESAAFVLLSTPDRVRIHGGRPHDGPPGNPCHVREWTNAELVSWLRAEKLPLVWWGWTVSNETRPDQVWTSLVVLSKTHSVGRLPAAYEQAGAITITHRPQPWRSDQPLKVWMTPTPSEAERDTTNAIHQIVLRLQKHLPAYGIELVEQPDNADLRVAHAGQGSHAPVDVAMYHGLYPTGMGMDGVYYAINSHVIQNLKTAKAITAPSQWIADVLRRDMHVNPHVIGWGVDADEWTPGENKGYVLWNKARQDWVCDPAPMQALAARAPEVPFVSTFGEQGQNVAVIGRQPFERMKQIIRSARVYLSTATETFGISTLEAMAAGVPVLGFRHGGTADLVEHGVSGFLAEPGDIDGLLDGLRYCMQHRAVLGANARLRALQYSWEAVARQMAEVFRGVLEPHSGAKCSVIIPCHDYGWCVGEAIESALAQETAFEVEILVVLDRCSDNSAEVVARYADRGVKALVVDNGNLSATRNSGIQAATGEYIASLDADDHMGSPHFLQTLADALDADRTLGIAFTSIRVMDAEGKLGHLSNWPKGYDFDQQARRYNQIPSLCLFRKEAWRRAGGFRPHFRYAEDAEFWTTVGALGYGAKHVVEDGWFHYRLHNKSASQVHRTGEVPEPDWTEFHPWTKDGQRPFAADGKPPQGSWPVRFYLKPEVTVIIPVGPGHEERVKDALHSLEGQTMRFWECIVVNDSGHPLDLENGFPWAKVVETTGALGAGSARNLGASLSHAPFLLFLDADDLLLPHFLEAALRAYRQNGRYVYTDWYTQDVNTLERTPHPTRDYSFEAIWSQPSLHPVTALIPTQWFRAVGGFDEDLTAFEDVDLFMKLLTHGFCGVRVPRPLLIYNVQYGQRRVKGEARKDEFKKLLIQRYGPWMEGDKMCNCVEPPKGKPPVPPTPENAAEYRESYGEMVKVKLTWQFAAESPVTFRGPNTRVSYGARARNDIFYIWEADLEAGMFERVESYQTAPEPTVTPPPPALVSEPAPEETPVVEEAESEAEDAPSTPDMEAMTKAELRQYADEQGIDLTGTSTKTEILKRIFDSAVTE